MSAAHQFQQAIEGAGLPVPDAIFGDGKLYRFSTNGKRADVSGWYLRTHAERLYSAAVVPETSGAAALLNKMEGGKLADTDGVLLESFTPRMVATKHWAGLGTPEAVRKAADLLADYGWLKRETVTTGAAGGRPSERYAIHPELLKGGHHGRVA